MRIGVDLGGTKIEAIALRGESEVVLRKRVATPSHNYSGTLDALVALVHSIEQELGQGTLPVGIGHPGSISPANGLIRNANSTCLNGQPLKQDLEARLQRELRLANDADCLAASEAADGAGAGARSVFAVILGTGSGSGIAADHARVTGEMLNGEAIVERAQQGYLAAEATLARFEDRLARALASVINLLDPEVIVLGAARLWPLAGRDL